MAIEVETDFVYDSHWLTLCHYNETLFGYESEIADPSFFLAENGRHSPEDEYRASYNAFFINKDVDAVSRFPARYRWMSARLNLPVIPVEERAETYVRYAKAVSGVEKIYFVFATDYVNQPESIYGHTLLRFDGSEGSVLLGQALNYAAATDNPGFVEYLIKGIGGGFSGHYTVDEYYTKVAEYSYTQSRDMYEYELALEAEEIALLTDHLYELDRITSPYYFFSANCSYSILYLIDAAYPEAQLIAESKPWVVPYDTVRILEKHSLITRGRYRPAVGSILAARARGMRKEEVELALNLAEGTVEAESLLADNYYTDEAKARILDLALDYYYYQSYPSLDESFTLNDMMQRSVSLSRARSRIRTVSYNEAERDDPLEGHAPFCIESGAGLLYSDPFFYLGIRPSYHEFSDPVAGYTPGGEVVFPSLTVSYLHTTDEFDSKNIRLEELTFTRITSFKSRSKVLKPLSWRIDLGAERDMPRTEELGGYIFAGAGGMWLLGDELNFYSLAGAYATYSNDTAFAPELESGVLSEILCNSRLHLYVKTRYYLASVDNYLARGGATLAVPLVRDFAVVFGSRADWYKQEAALLGTVSAKFYF